MDKALNVEIECAYPILKAVKRTNEIIGLTVIYSMVLEESELICSDNLWP